MMRFIYVHVERIGKVPEVPLYVTLELARASGAFVTCSFPCSTSVPAFVKLDRDRLNPDRVTVEAAFIARVEIATFTSRMGMTEAVDTISALSVVPGTPLSQFKTSDQSV